MPGSRNVPIMTTWADFLQAFIDKYIPVVYKDKKKLEFLNLKQEELLVVNYKVQFMRLSKYAPEEVATDELKSNKFERGLNLEIREKILVKPPTYRKLLETAIRAEEIILKKNELEAKKKKTTSMFTSFSFRTGGESSFRGSGFQQGSFRRQGISRPTQLTGSSSDRGFRRSGNRRDGRRGRSISSISTSTCNKCGRFYSSEC